MHWYINTSIMHSYITHPQQRFYVTLWLQCLFLVKGYDGEKVTTKDLKKEQLRGHLHVFFEENLEVTCNNGTSCPERWGRKSSTHQLNLPARPWPPALCQLSPVHFGSRRARCPLDAARHQPAAEQSRQIVGLSNGNVAWGSTLFSKCQKHVKQIQTCGHMLKRPRNSVNMSGCRGSLRFLFVKNCQPVQPRTI